MIEDTREEGWDYDKECEWKESWLTDRGNECADKLKKDGSVQTPCGDYDMRHVWSHLALSHKDNVLCVAAKDSKRLHVLIAEFFEPHFDADAAYDSMRAEYQ